MKWNRKQKYKIKCLYPDCGKIFVVEDPADKIPKHPLRDEYMDPEGNYLRKCPGSYTTGEYIDLVDYF